MSLETVSAKPEQNLGSTLATPRSVRSKIGYFDHEIHQVWRAFFSQLRDGASLLDLVTEDGVIAAKALELARERGQSFEIHACDADAIDTREFGAKAADGKFAIHFRSGVSVERLPYENGQFDAVCGHFAIEFYDQGKALAEVHRVLKPNSDAQFVLHHADSTLVQGAKLSLNDADLVLNETKIFRRLHRLVTMENATKASSEQAGAELQTAIRAIKQALPAAREKGGGRGLIVTLEAVQKLLLAHQRLGPQAVGLHVERAEADFRASIRKAQNLITHALSVADMAAFEKRAAQIGFSQIESTPQLYANQHLLGWTLMMHRG